MDTDKTNLKTNLSPVSVEFKSYRSSVPEILDKAGAHQVLKFQKTILIKPNLVNADPHPITTHPDFCDAVISYVKTCTKARVIIGEGCGDDSYETNEIFNLLGYTALARKHGIDLVDLNHESLVRLERPGNILFPEMYLPEIAFKSYILSLPVLKAHSLAAITGTLKNMMGFAPPQHYSGSYGIWKKSLFHGAMQASIIELNRYITPHLSLMDASVGLAQFHLGGPRCSPPANRLIAGFDPVMLDRAAAGLLGLDWKSIKHLTCR